MTGLLSDVKGYCLPRSGTQLFLTQWAIDFTASHPRQVFFSQVPGSDEV